MEENDAMVQWRDEWGRGEGRELYSAKNYEGDL